MVQKTVAMRVLEGQGVDYEALTYPATERDAVVVARHLGVAPQQVFKTLVVVRERGKPFLAMVPADRNLDLKRMAKAVGEKKLKMASHAEAETLTRLEVGGISPLALLNRGFEMVIDASARNFETVFVSAGAKGTNLRVPVDALLTITGAKLLDISSVEAA